MMTMLPDYHFFSNSRYVSALQLQEYSS